MTNSILVSVGILLSSFFYGEGEKDPVRMNRDLKIAEDIMATLYKNESKDGHFYSVRPKATYVPGFGVMINVANNNHFYSESFGKTFNFHWEDGSEPFIVDVEALTDIKSEADKLALEAEKLAHLRKEKSTDAQKRLQEIQIESRALEMQAREIEQQTFRKMGRRQCCPEGDSGQKSAVIKSKEERALIFEEMKNMNRRVMIMFMTDYADLIAQLEDDEKIMITTELGGEAFSNPLAKNRKNKFSAMVLRKDLNDFKKGNISKEKFLVLIEFTENKGDIKSPDLELLSSIFERLYRVDLAVTYYCNASVPYERLDNFGAIYKMKVYSSTTHGKDNHTINATGQTGLTKVERDKIVDGMYSQFVEDFKGNVLDYCKTVNSLAEDETIVFQIALTECRGCEMPKQVDISVTCDVLRDYDQGKMKRDEALSRCIIKESR